MLNARHHTARQTASKVGVDKLQTKHREMDDTNEITITDHANRNKPIGNKGWGVASFD